MWWFDHPFPQCGLRSTETNTYHVKSHKNYQMDNYPSKYLVCKLCICVCKGVVYMCIVFGHSCVSTQACELANRGWLMSYSVALHHIPLRQVLPPSLKLSWSSTSPSNLSVPPSPPSHGSGLTDVCRCVSPYLALYVDLGSKFRFLVPAQQMLLSTEHHSTPLFIHSFISSFVYLSV